jgi:hypothetical protein
MTAMAAVDRLVQHAIILHFDGDSLRATLGSLEKSKSGKSGGRNEPANLTDDDPPGVGNF